MKAYKIFIPEMDNVFIEKVLTNVGHMDKMQRYTRAEIHELVQKHAFGLGWSWDSHETIIKYRDLRYLYFNGSGLITHGFSDADYFEKHENTEISWQDFLKLTPADVSEPPQGSGVPDLPELTPSFQKSKNNALYPESQIRDLLKRPPLKPTNELQKNDRNEKAWDILKLLIGIPYSPSLMEISKIDDMAQWITGIRVSDAFRYADEFIRQSNAGEKTEE